MSWWDTIKNPGTWTKMLFPWVVNKVPVLAVLPVWENFAGKLSVELPDNVRNIVFKDRYGAKIASVFRHADGTTCIEGTIPSKLYGMIVEIHYREE